MLWKVDLAQIGKNKCQFSIIDTFRLHVFFVEQL